MTGNGKDIQVIQRHLSYIGMAKSSKCPEICQELEELSGLKKQARDVALKR